MEVLEKTVTLTVTGVQEYIVNLWTQNREMSQPWSMHTFQGHINNETGSAAAFDSMWAQMQKIIGTALHLLHCFRGMTGTPATGIGK